MEAAGGKAEDVLLLENEFVPPEWLRGPACYPTLSAYTIFRDKLLEKELAVRTGLRTPRFSAVSTVCEIRSFLAGTTGVLKARTGGYDGYGNLTVDAKCTDTTLNAFLARGPAIIEEKITFLTEVAVMVVRAANDVRTFPVAETLQQDHVCRQVLAPARLSPALQEKICRDARAIVEASGGEGLFGVEFFVSAEGTVLYNETAPRPHNSAHFTLDACEVSQFGALLQAALGLPLTEPVLKTPWVGMLNLLGTSGGDGELRPLAPFLKAGALWMYGKKDSRPGRKMGHYTLCGTTPAEILGRLDLLQKEYRV
jgi:5-(carboxyamino)imidazole ribonucleotide synthase